MTLRLNFTYVIWLWQFAWREGWTPDSIIRFGCDVNIKSMQEEELFKIWVGSFMIWLKPKLAVKMSIFYPSIFVMLLAYHQFDFALKSPRTTTIYSFFNQPGSILNSKLSENFLNSSLF